MDVKIVISVFISTILVAAIYSSSAYFVSGAVFTHCDYSTDGKRAYCQVIDTEDSEIFEMQCTKNPDGKTWNCYQPNTKIVTEGSVPPELGDALDLAIQQSPNPTKGPKTGLLDEPGALSDDESTENGDDTKVPREDILPDDGEPTINDPQTTTEPKIKVPGKIEMPNLK